MRGKEAQGYSLCVVGREQPKDPWVWVTLCLSCLLAVALGKLPHTMGPGPVLVISAASSALSAGV